jgi:hypothetical protein
MYAKIPNRRTDDHLGLILHETANWTVNGRNGVALCEVASLRLAIDKAANFTAMGRQVVALVRRRPVELVVFAGQIQKLTERLSDQKAGHYVAKA